jgi:hypothetical protein
VSALVAPTALVVTMRVRDLPVPRSCEQLVWLSGRDRPDGRAGAGHLVRAVRRRVRGATEAAMTAEPMLPTFLGVRRAVGGRVLVERYDALPWLEDLHDGVVVGPVLCCPTCQARYGIAEPLQVDDEQLVWCGQCGDLWPLTVTAVVDLSGDEAPLLLAGTIPGGPAEVTVAPCRLCGCTDDDACEGGCWWIAPGVCSSHDLADAMRIPAVGRSLFDPPPTHDWATCCAGLPLFHAAVPGDEVRWRQLIDIGMATCPLCVRSAPLSGRQEVDGAAA